MSGSKDEQRLAKCCHPSSRKSPQAIAKLHQRSDYLVGSMSSQLGTRGTERQKTKHDRPTCSSNPLFSRLAVDTSHQLLEALPAAEGYSPANFLPVLYSSCVHSVHNRLLREKRLS
jgi:hypothetical protein